MKKLYILFILIVSMMTAGVLFQQQNTGKLELSAIDRAVETQTHQPVHSLEEARVAISPVPPTSTNTQTTAIHHTASVSATPTPWKALPPEKFKAAAAASF